MRRPTASTSEPAYDRGRRPREIPQPVPPSPTFERTVIHDISD
ncbi:hypothetical protein RVR_9759 [Actinacidiphila reveromycinica]|uniref:Uncharacterized protein n=1 Tax=Actinacidiphila reveromycinica TaxID=659352 RepID=A0A7U3V0I4_9ACTN|nr:hypothetical protein RVR_9759 [Streptomyces sp. SN-593]